MGLESWTVKMKLRVQSVFLRLEEILLVPISMGEQITQSQLEEPIFKLMTLFS